MRIVHRGHALWALGMALGACGEEFSVVTPDGSGAAGGDGTVGVGAGGPSAGGAADGGGGSVGAGGEADGGSPGAGAGGGAGSVSGAGGGGGLPYACGESAAVDKSSCPAQCSGCGTVLGAFDIGERVCHINDQATVNCPQGGWHCWAYGAAAVVNCPQNERCLVTPDASTGPDAVTVNCGLYGTCEVWGTGTVGGEVHCGLNYCDVHCDQASNVTVDCGSACGCVDECN